MVELVQALGTLHPAAQVLSLCVVLAALVLAGLALGLAFERGD
ncbi:hypothetical protein OV203_01520 [Nannocystis sp. ILAH1]|nr:hypothetical protein [Nannocystis sp. ILAH1]MCY0985790.1 hypothetical protein [Nannocystis sp. ILAH1]